MSKKTAMLVSFAVLVGAGMVVSADVPLDPVKAYEYQVMGITGDERPPERPPGTEADVYNGTLDGGSPTWDRIFGSAVDPLCNATSSDSGQDGQSYDLIPIFVTATEDLEAEVVSFTGSDTVIAVYCDPFDPLLPAVNLIAYDDDGGTVPLLSAFTAVDGVTLEPGNQYWFVLSTFSPGDFGDFQIDFTSATVTVGMAGPQGLTICNTPGVAIPDNDPLGVTDTIVVPDNITITDLDVYVRATHSWSGDVAFSLEHTDTTTTAVIIDQPGVPASTFGCSENDYDVTVNDEGLDTCIEDQCAGAPPAIAGDAPGGDPCSTTLLQAFDSEDVNGTWELTVTDGAGGDTGTLDEWCLVVNGGGGPPTGACCFPDGSCQDLTDPDCGTAGGNYQGDGTDCATTMCPLPPPNDDCTGALVLNPGQCVIVTNIDATDSGAPLPSCANYQGGDVWVQITIPAGQWVDEVFTQNGIGVTDTGMSYYAECPHVTEIQCDDDGGTGLFSSVGPVNGPGTFYVRSWEYGNDSTGEWEVCATELVPVELMTFTVE